MSLLVESLPPLIASNLSIITLLVIGFFVEEHYVGRITVLSNSVALNLHVARLAVPGFWLTAFADVGILLGVIGLITYISGDSLPPVYYLTTYFLYSSATIALVILFGTGTLSLLVAAGLGAAINYGLIGIFEDVAVAT